MVMGPTGLCARCLASGALEHHHRLLRRRLPLDVDIDRRPIATFAAAACPDLHRVNTADSKLSSIEFSFLDSVKR